jgi:hypothetical protein
MCHTGLSKRVNQATKKRVVKSLGQGSFRAWNIGKRIQKINLNNMAGEKAK